MHYAFLITAILSECCGTYMLKLSEGFTSIPYSVGCLIAYCACFVALGKALEGIPLNVAYATWCGVGIILATALSALLFKEAINGPVAVGIALVVVGVVIVNLFGPAH